ncbi:MAG: GNAT family N-acetyltransferase [Rhodanobacteraceae bacterium]
MNVREIVASDIPQWADLRAALWPDQPRDELEADGRAALAMDPPLIVFVAEVDGLLAGFIEFGFRSVAEGCDTSPVPYVEGWFVRGDFRRRGIGGALMRAVEDWCRARGFVELGSDANADNRLSRDVHAALGFDEVETLVVFRRGL